MSADLTWRARRSGPLRGELSIPGDKSISHRAIMLASLAEGVSRIDGFLEGEDTLATVAAFRAMGVRIEAPSRSRRIVHGVGLHGLAPAQARIDCGNAGTGMRLLAGLLAGQAFDSCLVGDASLSQRPMQRVVDPLVRMGADIRTREGKRPPLHVRGGQSLHGMVHEPEVASAQVKSAILLAGLYAEGRTEVREVHPTRDYTERMLAAFGWPVEFGSGWVRMAGGHGLHAVDVQVPADFSSAAFFLVAASLVPGSELLLRSVGVNARRTGLLSVLRLMGADIVETNRTERDGESVADLRVRHAPLHGIDVPPEWVADMIDEFPILFVAAAAASGTTRIRGAAELRVKESDRIAAMARGLLAMGAAIDEHADGATIQGGSLHAAHIDSAGDHRIAMSFAVAAQVADGSACIENCSNVATSFPDFDVLARDCGMQLRPLEGIA